MLKNIGSNWLLMLCTAAAVYVLTPFVIGSLGPDAYGVWLVIGSLTGYLFLIRGGVPASSVRSFSQQLAEPNNDEGLNAAIASSLAVYLIQAGLVFIGGVVLFGVFELFMKVPEMIRPQARIAFIIVVVQIGVNFPGPAAAHGDGGPRQLHPQEPGPVLRAASEVLRHVVAAHSRAHVAVAGNRPVGFVRGRVPGGHDRDQAPCTRTCAFGSNRRTSR